MVLLGGGAGGVISSYVKVCLMICIYKVESPEPHLHGKYFPFCPATRSPGDVWW
jgi:hypothetical protein